MAQKTSDYSSVLAFIAESKRSQCLIPDVNIPRQLHSEHSIPYLGVGLASDYNYYMKTKEWRTDYEVFVAGWDTIDGVMIIRSEPDYDADLRVGIAAKNERVFRDLLLMFPRDRVGYFYSSTEWSSTAFGDILKGQPLPGRLGYFATKKTFIPHRSCFVRKIGHSDYDQVKDQWDPSVWQDVLDTGYHVHVSHDGRLRGLCFHWSITDWRNEVHGLQAVEQKDDDYAKSVFSSATEEVIDMGKVATCTANLSDETAFLTTLKEIGYRPFYRVHSFRGIKRGSGLYQTVDTHGYFRRPSVEVKKVTQSALSPAFETNTKHRTKDNPIIAEFRDLQSVDTRMELGRFVVEGTTLVSRAVYDGLPVNCILYTIEALDEPETVNLLRRAHLDNIDHQRISNGVMGTVTSTRPLPKIVASVLAPIRDFANFYIGDQSELLIVDSVVHPGNLGTILRSADATGVDGVVFIGKGSSPFHPVCVNAARGAMGRVPLLYGRDEDIFARLHSRSIQVVGTSAKATHDLYAANIRNPAAIVIGNESNGMRDSVKEACTQMVRLPMYPGQSSLNVATAVGIILYEFVRNRFVMRATDQTT